MEGSGRLPYNEIPFDLLEVDADLLSASYPTDGKILIVVWIKVPGPLESRCTVYMRAGCALLAI